MFSRGLRGGRQSVYANWPEDDLVRISGRFYVKKLPVEQATRAKGNADDILFARERDQESH